MRLNKYHISLLTLQISIPKIISDTSELIDIIQCVVALVYYPMIICSSTGPPLITLSHGSINSFSLLPPQINRADVNLLTQDVILSTNLVGRWQKPDDTFVTDDSLTFSIFHQSDEGLYKFYVTNWDGEEILVIQIHLTINGMLFQYTHIVSPDY